MRPHGSPKTLERRRKRAFALLGKGLTRAQVAKRIDASFVSVYRWEKAVAENGLPALDAKEVPGRPRKLPESKYEQLWDILLAGAMAYGFANDLWTLKRIASVIRQEFGIVYHPNYVWEILHREGWSCQVPERRAIQRNEGAIAHWKRYKWPAIKKTKGLDAYLVFIDESGFLLIPTRRRTWAPRGQTPIIRYSYKHDRISALAALRVSAIRKRLGVYFTFQQRNFTAVAVAEFLRKLLRRLRGHVVLLWDNGKIHKGPQIQRLRHDYPRLHIEWLPGYAPELNPVEQIWNDFKGHSANSLPRSKQDIRLGLHANARRVRRSQRKLRSFFLASDLPTPPW